MKKYFKGAALTILFAAGFAVASSAQIVVKIRPNAPVVVRPNQPSPRHVWVDGGWEVRNGHYVRANGYWSEPRRGQHYRDGYWARRRGGYVWVPGRWGR